MRSGTAAQVDAKNPTEDRLQVGMAPADVRMIEPASTALIAADQRERTIDRQLCRLRLVGAGHRQAEHSWQKGTVIAFSCQHLTRPTAERTTVLLRHYEEIRTSDEIRAKIVPVFPKTRSPVG